MIRPLALALALVPGCSWISMTPPPDPPARDAPPRCTRSRAAPAIDLLLVLPASFMVGLIGWAAAGGDVDLFVDDEEDESGATAVGALAGIVTGGVLVASAISGFRISNACGAAEADYYNARRPRGPTPGTERGVCLPDGRCTPGLTCASGYCVRLR